MGLIENLTMSFFRNNREVEFIRKGSYHHFISPSDKQILTLWYWALVVLVGVIAFVNFQSVTAGAGNQALFIEEERIGREGAFT